MLDHIIHLRITDTTCVMRLASKINISTHKHIISIFFHCSFFEVSLMTLRCVNNFQMDNMIEHTLKSQIIINKN